MSEMIVNILMKCLEIILPAVCAFLAVKIKQLIAGYVKTEEAKSIVKTVVSAVEQMYQDLHGEEKLKKALTLAAAMLNEHGIDLDSESLRVLIESAVAEFNDVFKVEETVEVTK